VFDIPLFIVFQKTDTGWHEVLVDLDPDSEGLRYVLSKRQTLAVKTLLKVCCSCVAVPGHVNSNNKAHSMTTMQQES
jgi:hypothetical protein